jgi:hypothetical protein
LRIRIRLFLLLACALFCAQACSKRAHVRAGGQSALPTPTVVPTVGDSDTSDAVCGAPVTVDIPAIGKACHWPFYIVQSAADWKDYCSRKFPRKPPPAPVDFSKQRLAVHSQRLNGHCGERLSIKAVCVGPDLVTIRCDVIPTGKTPNCDGCLSSMEYYIQDQTWAVVLPQSDLPVYWDLRNLCEGRGRDEAMPTATPLIVTTSTPAPVVTPGPSE